MATELTIYVGCPVDTPLEFSRLDIPLIMTGLGPFVAQILDPNSTTPLLTFTVVETDLTTGKLNLTATAGDTQGLPLRDSEWGLVDSTGFVWVPASVVHIERKPVYP